MRSSKNLENKIPLDTCQNVQLVCMKGQAYSFSKYPMQYNQDQMKGSYDLFNQLGSHVNITHFQISSSRRSR